MTKLTPSGSILLETEVTLEPVGKSPAIIDEESSHTIEERPRSMRNHATRDRSLGSLERQIEQIVLPKNYTRQSDLDRKSSNGREGEQIRQDCRSKNGTIESLICGQIDVQQQEVFDLASNDSNDEQHFDQNQSNISFG